MKYSEARAALQDLGNEIGHYHQESHAATAPADLQGHISDGFCAGAALDWLRSVLHGAHASHAPDVVTAGVAFVRQKTAVRNEFYTSLNTRVNAARAADLAHVNQRIAAMNQNIDHVIDTKVKELADEKIRKRLPRVTQQEMDDIVDEVQAALRRKIESLRTEHETNFESPSLDKKYQAFWRQFGQTLDERLATRFGEHRYSNLTITRASASRPFGPPNGTHRLIETILAEPAFSRGTGALLGVIPGSGDVSGHSLAIHCLNTGDYHMFDPNFGIYRMDRATLLRALSWLFVEVYPILEDGTSDNKDYEIDGKVRGEYVIYAPMQQ